MQPMIDKDVLDRLVARGRRTGHITTEDLRQALPVDAMGPDEIALVVVHLEEQGVPVELDESLLAPHAGPRSAQTTGGPEIVLPPDPPEARPKPPPPDTFAQVQSAPAGTAPAPVRGLRPAHWAVALAGLLVVILLSIAIATFGR